jgi:hypothetical protein
MFFVAAWVAGREQNRDQRRENSDRAGLVQ